MNVKQTRAYNAVVNGHNVLICGQAGTGKTFLMKHIISHLQNGSVSVLCTTGMGSLQYHDMGLGATTVHSWAGLYDGRYDNLTLQDMVLHDDRYATVRKNILQTKIIIIDEVSMLSEKDFEQFEVVCRTVYQNSMYFGGLQVILCGDFYQLPPVGNAFYNDSGRFCFESKVFQESITHRIVLEDVVRQDEPMLIRAVRETALGCVSDDVDIFLKSLERPLPSDLKPVDLFARNLEATIFNNDSLFELKTAEFFYKATKSNGPEKYLKKILAPNYLHLKIDCPVILLKNLGGKLVNGLRGIVTNLGDDCVHVYFSEINQTHQLNRHLFSKYSITKKCNIAEREQFPLSLGYGLTIHKAQGMTLSCVSVHCKGIFEAGQMSVAIGRATSSSGLMLTGYRKGLCPQPKTVISKYYGTDSEPFSADLSCCKKLANVPAEIMDTESLQYDSDTSDFENYELDTIELVDKDTTYELPSYIDVESIKLTSFTDNALTETQMRINQVCLNLKADRLHNFCCAQQRRLKEILSDDLALKTTTPKDWTSILSDHHGYVTGDEYLSKVNDLFGPIHITDDHVNVASEIVFSILKAEVDNIANKVSVLSEQSSFRKGDISEAGKAKIRYVGGMCVAKCRNHHMNIITGNIGNPDQSVKDKVKLAQVKVNILSMMVADLDDRDINDQTLEEIERRQNVQRALTYITDESFQFFLHLNGKTDQILNMETLKVEKGNIFEFVKRNVEEDEELQMLFAELFHYNPPEANIIFAVYNEILYKYLMVCHKQLLKDTKDALCIQKKKAHREEILKKKEKKTSEVLISMQDILHDKSKNRERSHLKLKVNSVSSDNYFTGKEFTKKNLLKLCSAYSVSVSSNMKKEELASTLRRQVISTEHMNNPDTLAANYTEPSTSGESESKKRRGKVPSKGKGKGKSSSKAKYFCKVCKEKYIDGEEWILCDDCTNWFHRMCGGGLEDDEEWESVQAEEKTWSCAECAGTQ